MIPNLTFAEQIELLLIRRVILTGRITPHLSARLDYHYAKFADNSRVRAAGKKPATTRP